MAGSINKVILVGNLGRDPEVRTGQDGTKIVNFSVATSETWRDKASGERKERTEWHRIVIFNPHLAEVAQNYLKKGMKVYVEGQLQNRKFTDKDGQERERSEVVLQRFRGDLQMLDRAGGGGQAAADSNHGGENTASAFTRSPGGGRPPSKDLDDDIPF